MPDPIEDGDLYDGWREGLVLGQVRLTRCSACGTVTWYPTARCAHCRGELWEWFEAPDRGHLFSWCRVVRPTYGISELAPPYVYGIVELPAADDAHLVALAGDPTRRPQIGAEVAIFVDNIGGVRVPRFVQLDDD